MSPLDATGIRQLAAAGETFTVEFKGENRGPLSDGELVEAAICLANGEGGILLVGVEDDGQITGARPRHGGHTDPRRVEALVANRTNPPLAARCSVVPIDELEVVVVEVPEASVPVGTVDGRYVRRALVGRGAPGCLPMHFHEMQSRQASHGAFDYTAARVAGAAWQDLDPLEFERFRRLIRESGGRGDAALVALPDLELAKSLGVVEANHEARAVRVAGLLLFGREEALRRLLPTHEVAFQELRGSAVGVNDFLRWPIPRAMEELVARFRARNREQELLIGAVRVAVPDFSPVAFREALANALVHRDYQQLGAVHVQWREDAVEIGNPGGFPAGVRLDNLLVAQPRPRNPLLADAVKRAGLVERTGRGVDTMFEEQLRAGRPAPDYSRSDRDSVLVALRDGPADPAMVRLVAEAEQHGDPLGIDELLVLTAARDAGRVGVEDAARLVQRPAPAAWAVLDRLVGRGLLTRVGTGAEPTWVAANRGTRTARATGDAAEAVRRAARERETVTRQDVVALTGLSADQAKRLLARLAEDGELVRVGRGRGAAYRARSGR